MTSESVEVANSRPSASSSARSRSALTMLPLWPRAMRAVGAVDEEGLGVLDAAGAGGGVAGVADGGEALEMQKVFLLEDLRDEAHVLVDDDALAVGCGDACALLTSMLQSIETEEGDSGDVFSRGIHPEDAAGLVEALQKALP